VAHVLWLHLVAQKTKVVQKRWQVLHDELDEQGGMQLDWMGHLMDERMDGGVLMMMMWLEEPWPAYPCEHPSISQC
jgi:hypothetical protein